MKLSVIIPAYNEQATILEILSRVQKAPIELEKEILVVDDASTDGTEKILSQLQDRQVKVIRQPSNQGKGAAVRRGLLEAAGDIVLIQDADLEYDPKDYPRLLEPLLDGRADVVYGSRFLGGPHRVLLFWHYMGNLLFTFLTNLLYNINLSDMGTGYKAFRIEALKAIPLRSDRFGFEAEITAKVCKRRLRLYEVPISYSGRTYKEGKKITWKDGLAYLWCLLRYRIAN